jgi:hypothetical protein
MHHHISVGDGVGLYEQLVSQRTFAMVNVRYDRKVPDHIGWHLHRRPPSGVGGGILRVRREGRGRGHGSIHGSVMHG